MYDNNSALVTYQQELERTKMFLEAIQISYEEDKAIYDELIRVKGQEEADKQYKAILSDDEKQIAAYKDEIAKYEEKISQI